MWSHIVVLVQITSLKTIKHLVFVMEAQCVYCEVRSDSTYIRFSFTEGRTGTLRSKHNFILPLSLPYTEREKLAIINA
jgi:hypothetical protein